MLRDIKTSGLLVYLWTVNMSIEINTYKMLRIKRKSIQSIEDLQML